MLDGGLKHGMEEMEVLQIQRVCTSSRVTHISFFYMMFIRETLREVSADGDRMTFPLYANGLEGDLYFTLLPDTLVILPEDFERAI